MASEHVTVRFNSGWCDVAPDVTARGEGDAIVVDRGDGAWRLVCLAPHWVVVARQGAHICVAAVDGTTDEACYALDGGPWRLLGHAHGDRCLAIAPTASGFRLWLVTGPATHVVCDISVDGLLATPVAGTQPWTSQGILDVDVNGYPLWTDAHRERGGLLYAVQCGDLLVGQRRSSDGPDALCAATQGQRWAIYDGLCYTPRVAQDADGRYRIVSLLPGGQMVEIRGTLDELRALARPTPPTPEPPTPEPPPIPEPPPPTPEPPMPTIPTLADVAFLHANVSDWAQTSRVTAVRFGEDFTEVRHTMAGQWPVLNNEGVAIEGNPWIIAQVGGRWYAATYEWLRPGQTKKGITAENIGAHTKVEPLTSWIPRPGEVVGFMISAPARDRQRTVQERSDVLWTPWGDGARIEAPAPPVEPPVTHPVEPPVEPPLPEPTLAAIAEDVRAIRTLLERVGGRYGF